MQSTKELLKKIYNELPPLFPEDERGELQKILDYLERSATLTAPEEEDYLIIFGYKVWPWNRAFQEFLEADHSRLAEYFFLPRLSTEAAQRYEEFKRYGGDYHELHSGRAAGFFSDRHHEVREALLGVRQELREFTRRAVLSDQKARYLRRVESYQQTLGELKSALRVLQEFAAGERDYPTLAAEVWARVRNIELGLCESVPVPSAAEIALVAEFFHGRKQELMKLGA